MGKYGRFSSVRHLVTVQVLMRCFAGTIYVVPGFKHPKLILDDFVFHFQHNLENTSTRWRCTFYYRTRCKAALIVDKSAVEVVNEHNHLPQKVQFRDHNSGKVEARKVTIVRSTNC